MKKASLVMIIILLCAFFAGCGGTGAKNTATSENTKKETVSDGGTPEIPVTSVQEKYQFAIPHNKNYSFYTDEITLIREEQLEPWENAGKIYYKSSKEETIVGVNVGEPMYSFEDGRVRSLSYYTREPVTKTDVVVLEGYFTGIYGDSEKKEDTEKDSIYQTWYLPEKLGKPSKLIMSVTPFGEGYSILLSFV